VVETLSAMANADGGELVVGIEDEAIYLPGPRLLHQPHNASNESEADAMPPETDAMET
jgi:predicted HTH transcriptional regulator